MRFSAEYLSINIINPNQIKFPDQYCLPVKVLPFLYES